MTGLSINLLKNKTYPTTQCATKFINSFDSGYTIAKGKNVSATTGVLQKDLSPVVGLTLWTPVRKFVACLTPEYESMLSLQRRVGENVDKLRQGIKHSYDDVIAIITGGVAYDSGHPKSEESTKIIDTLVKALDKKGVETSVIAEQFADSKTARMNSYNIANNFTLWGEPVNFCNLTKSQKTSEISDALSEEFDFVEFSKYIPINVTDKLPTSAETSLKMFAAKR